MAGKHIATYVLYSCHPLTLRYTRHRVGTGYLYSIDDFVRVRKSLAERGHPFHFRWRNDECRRTTEDAWRDCERMGA